MKIAPCGQDGPDGRTDRVTVFAPRQSITVEWIEYVDHPSYYRVAFAPDGDDFPMRTNVPQKNSLIVPETPDVQLSEEQAVFVGSPWLRHQGTLKATAAVACRRPPVSMLPR